jgi:Tat protein secretion system quality control protein TatD with DNase activity
MHEQCRAFEAQLKLAAKWLKPIVIHSRDAYEITFKLMKQVKNCLIEITYRFIFILVS